MGSAGEQFRYKAFISYSHRDKTIGDWLHKALEGYRIPKRLIGSDGRDGPVPPRLFPIFRDREELPSSADLGQQITESLAQSAYLIAICSPNSARSRWVNEEILSFKRMGRERRILALIIDGEPNAEGSEHGERECFPRALKFALAEDGGLSTRRVEPIAADLRPQGDGRENAKLKIVAGLLGIGFDALKQRELESQRVRFRRIAAISSGVAAALAALAIMALLQSIEAGRQRDAALLREARFLASVSGQALVTGDVPKAVAVALEAEPFDGHLPGSADARFALAGALGRLLQSAGPILAHRGVVEASSFSTDGTRVLTASGDGTATVWDSVSGLPVTQVRHDGPLTTAGFSRDGRRIITASQDHTARIWDAGNGKPVGAPMQHASVVTSAVFSPDGTRVVTASVDGPVQIWDAATGAPAGPPIVHRGARSAAFSPDGRRVVSMSISDGAARLWDAETGAPVGSPMQHEGEVQMASFSPNGGRIVTASGDGTARLWDATNGASIGMPMRHQEVVHTAVFSSDGLRIVTGSNDKTARIWDAATGAQVGAPLNHDNFVFAAVFSPDGKYVATASADNSVRLWDATTGLAIAAPLRHDGRVRSIAFSADSRRLVSSGEDKTARIWNVATARRAQFGPDIYVTAAAYSPDGKRIVTASLDSTARVWDAGTGAAIGSPMRHDGKINTARFSPDGARILTASDDGMARIWEAETGAPVTTIVTRQGAVWVAALSPDGKRVVTASWSRAAGIWDVTDGAPLVPAISHGNGAVAASFSPDGTRVLIASIHDATIWSASDGSHIASLVKDANANLTTATFSPDGKRVLTSSKNGSARLWDAATGAPIGRPMAHDSGVGFADFSPDGQRVVTASFDNTARLWSAKSGAPLSPPMRHGDFVEWASFSHDGSRIVTASRDKTTREWDAATGAPIGNAIVHDLPVKSAVFDPEGGHILAVFFPAIARVWDADIVLPPLDQRRMVAYLASFRGLDDKEREALFLEARDHEASADPCDAGAGDPFDPRHVGRAQAELSWDTTELQAACEAAVAAQPSEPRFKYQLARVLVARAAYDRAVELFQRASDAGYPMAHFGLGALYSSKAFSGLNIEKALAEYREAFRLGVARANYDLGILYWDGDGVPADRREAMRLWQKAAEAGDPLSHELLAVIGEIRSGRDIEKIGELLYHWSAVVELGEQMGLDTLIARARRASVARYLAGLGKYDLLDNTFKKAHAQSQPSISPLERWIRGATQWLRRQ